MRGSLRLVVAGLAAALAAAFAVMVVGAPAASAAAPCAASFIGVPGSGQSQMSSAEMTAVRATVAAQAAAAGQPLAISSILSYPAVPWYRYTSGKWLVPWNELGVSEATGQQYLTFKIGAYRAWNAATGCADAPILLAGYSQGSEVVIRTVDALPADVRKTISVALLGNPSFTPNRSGDLNLNSDTSYRGIRPSLLFGQKYTLRSDVLARTIDVCAASDPICAYHVSVLPGLLWGRSAHYHYTSLTYNGSTLTSLAGRLLWARRYIPRPPTPTPPAPAPKPLPSFSVMNTSETPPDGVWFRNSPHTADTSRTTGLGVYAGDVVQLRCYAFGDAVGQYNDSLWYLTSNLTRPRVPSTGQANAGFLNAHYINDGQLANVVDAGVPAC